MASSLYIQRLQQALNYAESYLESEISLADLAAEAGYSPGHFVWIFREVIGQTPMEYVRGRRMTEAARAILSGDDIVDSVYRFGFSAQDAFTRSFRRAIGMPPGQMRRNGGTGASYTLALNLQYKGGNKMLNYNLDCDALDSFLRIEQLLTEETKELITRTAIGPVKIGSVDPHVADELKQARIISLKNGNIRIDTAVFMEEDLERIHGFAGRWGVELAERIAALNDRLPEMSPGYRRLLIGMNGIDQGVFDLLISGGYAFNHRTTTGRYAGAKVDFYELCDAYDRFGPYLSGGYGYHGERFAVKIIGNQGGIFRYLNSGISLEDNEQYAFRTNANKYLTDAIGELLLGEVQHASLAAAVEAAGLMKDGKALVPVITEADAPVYWNAAKLVRSVIREFLRDTGKEINNFLKDTLPGKQGVSPDKLIVDLMRYVRKVTHKTLYDEKFYTDSLLEGESITVYRELAARTDGK